MFLPKAVCLAPKRGDLSVSVPSPPPGCVCLVSHSVPDSANPYPGPPCMKIPAPRPARSHFVLFPWRPEEVFLPRNYTLSLPGAAEAQCVWRRAIAPYLPAAKWGCAAQIKGLRAGGPRELLLLIHPKGSAGRVTLGKWLLSS